MTDEEIAIKQQANEFAQKTRKEDTSSDFSKFFRKASYAQKRKVFLEVAKKASKEQLEVIQSVQ
ncbi:MAG: hypothetical protein WC843_06115 [Candidatus Gracilibacteria bacterium]|jgi:hypothetical protein